MSTYARAHGPSRDSVSGQTSHRCKTRASNSNATSNFSPQAAIPPRTNGSGQRSCARHSHSIRFVETRILDAPNRLTGSRAGGSFFPARLRAGINGIWSPLFEELGWRGRLQRSLADIDGLGWALFGTSLLFSLKHAFIDLSPGHLVTVMGIGLCLGAAYRQGDRRSRCTQRRSDNIGLDGVTYLTAGRTVSG